MNSVNCVDCCRESLVEELQKEEAIVERLVAEINSGKK